jgi:hypothetical protein
VSTWAALRRRRITLAAVAAAGAIVLAAGCGGDDEEGTETAVGPNEKPPTRTATVPAATTPAEKGTSTSKEKGEPAQGGAGESPEDQPGGAGDEEPARSEVVVTGKGGQISPGLVKVPPFVSIQVVLRSGDGKPYVVAFGKKILRAGLKDARSSATFDGLRPGKRLVGTAVSGRIVIEASAEPGP